MDELENRFQAFKTYWMQHRNEAGARPLSENEWRECFDIIQQFEEELDAKRRDK